MMDRYIESANRLNLIATGQTAGVVYWKPAGLKLYEKLKKFIRAHHEEHQYQEVKSPSIVVPEVFARSGHSDKYKDNMFFLNEDYALRPMSCPNHILLYQSEKRNHKEMPLKLFEFGDVYRNEPSGSLQLLFRQRQFCQDDSHVFVSAETLTSTIAEFLSMSQTVYQQLGFTQVEYAISTRPEKRFGSEQDWDRAEQALRDACRDIDFVELPGEGAFYGPKIELKVRDKLGRSWQLGTMQLDYVLPERFGLEYYEHNEVKRPILLHHAVLGSLERMIGILLEIFGVDLPDFLHPYESVVVPISEKSYEYAKSLSAVGHVDMRQEPLGKKLKDWRQKGVPRIYVVGEVEQAEFLQTGVKKAVLNQGDKKTSVII